MLRALCWERKHCEVPDIMSSEAEQGMAKLCIEFITSSTNSQTDKAKKENSSDKEINESTPKVGSPCIDIFNKHQNEWKINDFKLL